jgi:hypothetical protein
MRTSLATTQARPGRKLLIIWDRLQAHRNRMVRDHDSGGLGSPGERQGRPARPAMAFHGQRRHGWRYILVHAEHAAMGDVFTQGQ